MRFQGPFLDPGATFAHYEVQSIIGRGGMGVVYLAHDAHLDRKVALKLLAPEFTTHENFRARFLAMRFVPGADLRAELDERSRLPLADALDLLQQVADALDAAHSAELVHRDVKPANILLAERSRKGHRHAYLTDFGLTRRSSSISGLTTAGHFLGTLDYVAPEQIRGDPVDGRADVYSFACVAFAVLAGRPPFHGEDDVALMWAHLSREAPRVAAVVPELAGDVDDALAAGLAKSPDDRPATCGALVGLMEGRTGTNAPATIGPTPPAAERPPPESWEAASPTGPEHPSSPDQRVQAPAGPAAPSGGDRNRRTRSLRWLPVIAAAALVAVAAAVALVLLRPWGEELTTFATEDVPYTLEVPAEWEARGHDAGDSSVSVLSPADLTGLFADDPEGMRTAARVVATDPGAAVGLAIYHQPRLDGDTPATQLTTARALLPGQDVTLRPGEPGAAGDLDATDMSGTLGLGDGTALQLRVLALDATTGELLVFFAPPSEFASHVETFDRVADSVDSVR